MTEVANREMLTTSMPGVLEPTIPMIEGDATGKHILTMRQFTESDILDYIDEAEALERIIDDPNQGGVDLLRFVQVRNWMRQPSTRTDGSFDAAIHLTGANVKSFADKATSSEAKEETFEDMAISLATQAAVIILRDEQAGNPERAAKAIDEYFEMGKLKRRSIVINAGDGTNEHVTQALGDLMTIKAHQGLETFGGRSIGFIGDLERYRAFKSLMIGSSVVGMQVHVYQCDAAPVPEQMVEELGDSLSFADSLDELLANVNSLYVGRNPKEYKGADQSEVERSRELAAYYEEVGIRAGRLDAALELKSLLHPRPRGPELHVSIDSDPRAADVMQMEKMTPTRGAILLKAMGKSVRPQAA